jgi:hypothetical protein
VTKLEALLWSIALPGFGQLLQKQYIKGVLFVILEFLINAQSNFNEAIRLSFMGDIHQAIFVLDFQWIMFYPCLYFFAMWDAFKEAGPVSPYSFLPFVFSAYFVTVGVMYSTKLKIGGILLGPIWLPMLFVIPGVIVGWAFQWILSKKSIVR